MHAASGTARNSAIARIRTFDRRGVKRSMRNPQTLVAVIRRGRASAYSSVRDFPTAPSGRICRGICTSKRPLTLADALKQYVEHRNEEHADQGGHEHAEHNRR